MQTIIKSPVECTKNEINTFIRMTTDAKQVTTYQLEEKVLRAKKLAFININGSCVAIAALKIPADTYKNKVFSAANVKDKLGDYSFEIGYIYSTIKGVGNKLMKGVINASEGEKVFATTRDTNEPMQYLLPKYGFNKLGVSYKNDSNEYCLGLFGN